MSLKISRILHAGYVFEAGSEQIVFDPIFESPFSRNCYAFPDVKFDLAKIKAARPSAVFISHYHDDHCSLESLNLLSRETPIYLYCLFDEMFEMIRELGFENVHSLELNRTISIGALKVTPRKALDEDVDSIFEIESGGLRVLNVVDSWIAPDTLDDLAKSGPWDVVLWPFQTMRELEVISPRRGVSAPAEILPEWLEALNRLKPRVLVASSCQFLFEKWSWLNHSFFPMSYAFFANEMGRLLPECRVVRMNPGVSYIVSNDSMEVAPSLTWVIPIGNQNLDYEFRPDARPPLTSSIAKNFSALLPEQVDRVLRFCQSEILDRYRAIGASLDGYFDKMRLWRLSIFDHSGEAIEFYFKLLPEGGIERVEKVDQPLAWCTEVPIARLYGALEQGESLTSMYLRVNDCNFDSEIEADLSSVDVVEDPLIRCLFTGVFGGYQAAQLKRISSTCQSSQV